MPGAAAGLSGSDLACVRGERMVFQDLSFAVGPGACLILRGANGSGKSSLLRLCAGFLEPYAGALCYDGEPVHSDLDAYRARLRYIGHFDPLKPVLTVAENVRFWARLADATDRVPAALERLGLADLADVPARLLSAGQRRRVNLARLLLAPADIWLLDEPTTALDQATVSALGEVVTEHRRQGGLVLAATHVDMGLTDVATLWLDSRPEAA